MTDKNKVGMLLFLASESIFFGLLILAYVYYRSQWIPTGGPTSKVLDVGATGFFSVFLFSSSGTIRLAERSLQRGRRGMMQVWLLATVVLGAVFLFGQGLEYSKLFGEGITLRTGLFGTTFFTLTGFHGFHVFVGLIALSIVLGLSVNSPPHTGGTGGGSESGHSSALETASLYWHFVDVVWVVIFSLVYVWTLLS